MLETSDGGYLLGGSSLSSDSGDVTGTKEGASFTADYWVVKIDSDGAIQWDSLYGGSGNDQLSAMLKTSDGGYLLGGHALVKFRRCIGHE